MSLQKQNKRIGHWMAVFIWVVVIYGTLYWVRPFCEFLRQRTPFNLLINTSLLLSGLSVLILFWRSGIKKTPTSVIGLVIIAGLYIAGSVYLKAPEERIHFLEYGILSFLCVKALDFHLKGKFVFLGAWILSSVFGYIDEIIQFYLPNRYFQWQDVALNSISALLAGLLIYMYRKMAGENTSS